MQLVSVSLCCSYILEHVIITRHVIIAKLLHVLVKGFRLIVIIVQLAPHVANYNNRLLLESDAR